MLFNNIKMNVKKQIIALMLLLVGYTAIAQSKADLSEAALYHFEMKDYEKAYSLYDQLCAKYPTDLDFKFKLGLSCINYVDKKQRAIEIFEELKKETNSLESSFYLGKSYHINYKFDQAIQELEAFKQVNRNASKEEKKLQEDADVIIKNCQSAKLLIDKKVIADFKNLGSPVNTEDDEYSPAITADEGIMVFTYRGVKSTGGKLNNQLKPDEEEGEYHEDVYITTMNADSTWSAPRSVLEVNTNGNDAAISISPDGRNLFLFQSSEKNSGDIYMSVLTGTTFSKPEPLNENINSDFWEGSCSISADGQVMYFASERPGGYGGRDIWASVKINNDWGPAINLGPKVNTNLDDDAPFIHPDGITLFFSSKGHNSIGGYDIMFSIMKENEWTEPHSMGIPLNTTEDDIFYVINSKGDRGYFSSNRPSGVNGKGKEDIYSVSPGILGDKPIVAVLKGIVYGNDKPIEASIEVVKNKNNKLIGPFISNATTGKYLMAISPGSTYRIRVVADGFESIKEDIDIEKLDKYLEIKKDFYMYPPKTDTTKAVVTPTVAETPSVTVSEDPCATMLLPDFAPLKGKSLNVSENYKTLMDIAGEYCAQSMVFKVQIGAYRKPQNFKYKNLQEFGQAEVNDYPDGITRFTQQQFKTLKDAEVLRQKAIAKGQTDAWIVAFVNGKRYTLEELIMIDFLGKSVN